jgi:hypothetical protein
VAKKYVDCNFGYWDRENDRNVSLIYTGKDKGMGNHCHICKEKIHGPAHYFTEVSPEFEEWVFGPECVKHVFGAGLHK